MDELISKQDAIEAIHNLVATMSVCISMDECNGMRSMKERAINAINDLPSVQLYVSPLSREAELNECDKISRWARGEADG